MPCKWIRQTREGEYKEKRAKAENWSNISQGCLQNKIPISHLVTMDPVANKIECKISEYILGPRNRAGKLCLLLLSFHFPSLFYSFFPFFPFSFLSPSFTLCICLSIHSSTHLAIHHTSIQHWNRGQKNK